VAILFLTRDEVLALHERSIKEFGGSLGLRDEALLASALAIPSSTFGGEFLHPSLAEMGAAYLFHLVMNHPFIDGNKRTGAAAARLFLLLNDARFDPDETEYGDLTLDVAAGRLSKDDAIAFFKKHVKS
jgi:death-on-curing protein